MPNIKGFERSTLQWFWYQLGKRMRNRAMLNRIRKEQEIAEDAHKAMLQRQEDAYQASVWYA